MIVVLGSTGGLGSELVTALTAQPAHEGERVVAASRRDLDLADPATIGPFLDRVAAEAPAEALHVVNAAGVSLNGLAHKLDPEAWETTLRVNLTANFHLLRALRPHLQGRPDGSLLVFGSVVSALGVPGTIAYATAKSGLHGFTRTAARELARLAGRVNCLDLGYFDRGMIEQVPPAALEQMVGSVPLQRLGTVEDLSEAVRFACRCRFLTGAVVDLNGGLT